MATKEAKESKTTVTPEGRLSFPSIFKASAYPQGAEPKYSCRLLWEKKTDLSTVKKIIDNAVNEKWPDKAKRGKIELPWRNGDEKQDLEGYAGMIYVTLASKLPPGIVGENGKREPKETEHTFFAGCYAKAQVSAYAWEFAGKKGVSLSLQNIKKTREGEPFSGRTNPEDVRGFEAEESTSDDPANYAATGSEDLGMGF